VFFSDAMNRTGNRNSRALREGWAPGLCEEGGGETGGCDNNVLFIRQYGPVQKLQYPDNPRDAHGQMKGAGQWRRERGEKKTVRREAARVKVERGYAYCPRREHKCAVEMVGGRRGEAIVCASGRFSERRRQSSDLNGRTDRGISTGTLAQKNRLQSISPFNFCFHFPRALHFAKRKKKGKKRESRSPKDGTAF